MNKKLIGAALAVNLIFMNVTVAKTNYSYTPAQPQSVSASDYIPEAQYPHNNTLRGSVVMVPAGATLNAVLTAPISSEYTNVGETVCMALNSDFMYNGKLIAPAGSTVVGTVIQSTKAKHGSMNGKLLIRFNQINTPHGTQIPISAVIKTEDGTGVLVGGTKLDVTKEYTKDLAAGSAAGALSGVVFGALAGGNIGRGAALGTAVGAGGGLVKSVWDKGNDVEIPSNASIELVLTQPATVSSQSYYYEN